LWAAALIGVLPALVAAAGANGWASATAPSGAFTVATPCSVSEVAALRGVAAIALRSVSLRPNSRVLCRKGKLLFLAGEVATPGVSTRSRPLFETLVAEVRADRTLEGTQSATRLSGRRAFVNRQAGAGAISQTGFVEIDRARVLFLIGGVQAGSDLNAAEQGDTVDRFFGSVRFAGR
jgi:hypothetical protein